MRNVWIVVGLLIGLSSSAILLAQAQREPIAVGTREGGSLRAPITRFDGMVMLKAKDGRIRPLRAQLRNWIIDNRTQIADFPEKGFMLVQLRGGDLTTIIDGKRQARREDEFWTVRSGSAMGVETGSDSAAVQILVVTEAK